MITVDSTGTNLTAAWNTQSTKNFLDVTRSPKHTFLFCRKVSGTWYTNDVSGLFVSMSDIDTRLANQYGVSEGNEVNFEFSNAPITVLSTAYTSGTTLTPEARFSKYLLGVDDWICISDYNGTEYRRITSTTYNSNNQLTSFDISRELDNDYIVGAEIRYAWILEPNADVAVQEDFFNGTIKVKTGFQNLSPQITIYQGKLNSDKVNRNNRNHTVTLTAQGRIAEIVNHEFVDRVEFDDRGVVSVPTFNSTNVGNGEATDIEYADGKFPDVFTTETWTATYQVQTEVISSVLYDESGWEMVGSVSGTITSGQTISGSANNPFTRFLADGSKKASAVGGREWTIDLTDPDTSYGGFGGFKFTIKEGDIKFVAGDTIRVYSQASGTIAVVKGKGYASTPIDTTLANLYPSKVVQFTIASLLAFQHENPETGTATALMDSTLLANVQAIPQDVFTEIRGFFPAGSKAIEVIDDALKPVLGWVFPTTDDHVGIYYYSPFILNTTTSFTLSADWGNTAKNYNVWEVNESKNARQDVKNRVVFRYSTGYNQTFTHEEDDSDSQAEYPKQTLAVQTENFDEIPLSTRFLVNSNAISNASKRILKRTRIPVKRFVLAVHPNAFLLELGDTPDFYSRQNGFQGRVWITRIRKNLATETVELEVEEATHLQGKYFKWKAAADPAASAIWDSTGFIGSVGEERIWHISDATDQLDILGNNNGTYNANLGKPDQFGNHVEDAHVWW